MSSWWRHPPLKMVAFSGVGDGMTRLYKWFHAKKFITFSYDLRWSQTLYQNCREWRDLKLCSWQLFHLRSSNGPKNYYKFSNSYNYIVSHITQVILWSFHNLNIYIHWNILGIFFYVSIVHNKYSVEVSHFLICFCYM